MWPKIIGLSIILFCVPTELDEDFVFQIDHIQLKIVDYMGPLGGCGGQDIRVVLKNSRGQYCEVQNKDADRGVWIEIKVVKSLHFRQDLLECILQPKLMEFFKMYFYYLSVVNKTSKIVIKIKYVKKILVIPQGPEIHFS